MDLMYPNTKWGWFEGKGGALILSFPGHPPPLIHLRKLQTFIYLISFLLEKLVYYSNFLSLILHHKWIVPLASQGHLQNYEIPNLFSTSKISTKHGANLMPKSGKIQLLEFDFSTKSI